MKPFVLLLSGMLFLAINMHAQEAALFGVIGDQLFTVNHETAATEKVVDIDLPPGVFMRDLTYHATEKAFFSFIHFMNKPRLVRFSWNGSYQDIGPLHIGGKPVSMIEAIDFNEADGHLYASVSTDGVDKYTETVVRINVKTAACTKVCSLHSIGRDADDFAFWSGKLYIRDGIPARGVSIIYACQLSAIENDNTTTQKIKQTSPRSVSDLSAMNGFLYGTDNKYQLIRYALDSKDAVIVGKTHSPDLSLKEKRMVGLATVKLTFAK